jgi:Protein of unknown function, DUF547
MSIKFHTSLPADFDPVAVSADLLAGVREESDVAHLLAALGQWERTELVKSLQDDNRRKAFWINVYNAFNLLKLRAQPAHNKADKARHFFSRDIVVAGQACSLNDIEHRILRRSRRWWGRGRWRRWWPGAWEMACRVDALDARIHFALNCGAVSCPPIRAYTAAEIDAQLDLATQGYLATEIDVMEDGKLKVSGLFRMYEFDFGGLDGVIAFILRYRPELGPVKGLRFKEFDGNPLLNHFSE